MQLRLHTLIDECFTKDHGFQYVYQDEAQDKQVQISCVFCAKMTTEVLNCKDGSCVNFDRASAVCNECYRALVKIFEDIFLHQMETIEDQVLQ